ncbi:uncharacterized protein LOC117733637 [Cyclopterus lumpus]|uniref:uncharacterized protein LOC117733637 n=1 Tax=Cyclopterus lumpus TaxID=8103 RepID=UPI001486F4DD|nr:uncharacterized protein LOC117733637 [Cyclopterus lumpus]
MDGLLISLVALLGVASCSRDLRSGSVLEVTVRPGDNVTVYCDCKVSGGVYIVWYRDCSHENQPSLVLKVKIRSLNNSTPPSFHFVKNFSSDSFDLLIVNITDSNEGLYYCGTEQKIVEDKEFVWEKMYYEYGNVTTRILFNSSEPHREPPRDGGECWILLVSLCPAFAVLSSLLSSLLVYQLCQKKAPEPQADQERPQTRLHQEEDICYAALEIRQASRRSEKKKTRSSDFSTYSAINTSRM